jgi:hypothetical protein
MIARCEGGEEAERHDRPAPPLPFSCWWYRTLSLARWQGRTGVVTGGCCPIAYIRSLPLPISARPALRHAFRPLGNPVARALHGRVGLAAHRFAYRPRRECLIAELGHVAGPEESSCIRSPKAEPGSHSSASQGADVSHLPRVSGSSAGSFCGRGGRAASRFLKKPRNMQPREERAPARIRLVSYRKGSARWPH